MSKVRLSAVKELLDEKDYAAARTLLETMPDDATAQRWLAQMGTRGKSRTTVTSPQAGGSRRNLVIVGIVCLLLGWAAGNSGQRTATQQQSVAVQPTRAVVAVQSTPIPTQPVRPTAVPQPIRMTGRTNDVVGPEQFPAGVYRVTAWTDGFMTVRLTATEGTCYEGTSGFITTGTLFILMQGQAVDGAETLMTSEGCSALIEVSNVQEDWELKFEKVG